MNQKYKCSNKDSATKFFKWQRFSAIRQQFLRISTVGTLKLNDTILTRVIILSYVDLNTVEPRYKEVGYNKTLL